MLQNLLCCRSGESPRREAANEAEKGRVKCAQGLSRLVARGTEDTGGRREQLLADMAIPEALTKLADELLNQYVVSYARPNSTVPPEKLKVTVKNPSLTARAGTRLPNTR